MTKNNFQFLLNLQLFAEGGAGGDGGTAGTAPSGVSAEAAVPQTTKGVKADPYANVQFGIMGEEAQAPAAEEPTKDRAAEFKALIKGEYKEQYNALMQDTLSKRLKGLNETAEKYNSLAPTLELLGRKYGVSDINDIAALNAAIEADDSYFEDEAYEKGLTVEQLKEIRKLERENAEIKRQMQEAHNKQAREEKIADWTRQEQELKAIYPKFDLNQEILANPKFGELLKNNIDVRTAYEVIHKDDIIPAAMSFTAQQVEKKLVNKMMSGSMRPTENGMNSQGAVTVKSDVSQLSKADRAEVIRRVSRGEKISFGNTRY